jgi:hypothetical protein
MPYIGPFGVLAVCGVTDRLLARFRVQSVFMWESLIIAAIAIFGYIIFENLALLRAAGLIFLNFILISVVSSQDWRVNRIVLIDRVYWINILLIIGGYFYAPLAQLLSRSGIDINRLGGLVGYDFVAFFVSTYLINKFKESNKQNAFSLFFHITVASFAVINSGRFGSVVFLFLLVFLVKNLRGWVSKGLILLAVSFIVFIFAERSSLILATYFGAVDFLKYSDDSQFFAMNTDGMAGFYSASPALLISEYDKLSKNIFECILPSSEFYYLDSGPAYIMTNCGVLYGLLFYGLLIKVVVVYCRSNLFITVVFFLTDLKFRMGFSLFSMFWISINSSASSSAVKKDERLVIDEKN